MKALILAAGLGTRMMPLTANVPKALLLLNGSTLLEIVIRKLAREGFRDIIINVHHHAGQVREFLKQFHLHGVNISISDESELLLDTGGAIRKASWFLDGSDPFLVHNVDVISDIDLRALLDDHIRHRRLATLSVIDRESRRYFLFDEELRLKGWMNTVTGEIRWAGSPIPHTNPLAFSGIHIIDPGIFRLMNEGGRFSIIDTYLKLAVTENIAGYRQDGMTWFDMGKPEQFEKMPAFLKDHPEYLPGS
ncbi:MAG: sugar phosphate nucleotidyltransferase [Bacteroidales bacterium]|nr:sugar phosphate nucleotidyltransferase [Bacteroidales bacterium]